MSILLEIEDCLEGSFIDSDFLNFYTIDISSFNLEEESIFERVCGLVGNLPNDSQTMTTIRGGEYFSITDLAISRLEFLVHGYMLANSKGKKKEPQILLPEYLTREEVNDKEMEISPKEYVESHKERVERILRKKGKIPPKEEKKDETLEDLANNSNFS